MDPKDILKKIIQHEGSCTWASKSICAQCPLGKLKQRDDGNYLSCIEAVNVEDLSESEADAKYKAVAENTLADKEIESILDDKQEPNSN